MYIEFGRGTVAPPPLTGLMEIADRFDGTVAITAEGVSVYLPFNETIEALRIPEIAEVLELHQNWRPDEVEIATPQVASASQRGRPYANITWHRESHSETVRPRAGLYAGTHEAQRERRAAQ